ncbi:hypothetical protein EES40_36670 [Streptomyces sp. ADI93-02]|nr:hypothetical protein EES40_36670 [Streptomyces sp. ADI93-02]
MSGAGNRIQTRFDYWIRAGAGVLRESTETFWMWPAWRAELVGDLALYGFVPRTGVYDQDVLAMTLRMCSGAAGTCARQASGWRQRRHPGGGPSKLQPRWSTATSSASPPKGAAIEAAPASRASMNFWDGRCE